MYVVFRHEVAQDQVHGSEGGIRDLRQGPVVGLDQLRLREQGENEFQAARLKGPDALFGLLIGNRVAAPGYPDVKSGMAEKGVPRGIEEEHILFTETLRESRAHVIRNQGARGTVPPKPAYRRTESAGGKTNLDFGQQVDFASRMANPNLGIRSIFPGEWRPAQHLHLEPMRLDRLSHLLQEIRLTLQKVTIHGCSL